jgi:hypothetical protein
MEYDYQYATIVLKVAMYVETTRYSRLAGVVLLMKKPDCYNRMSLFDYFVFCDFVMHPLHPIHFTVPCTTALYVRFFFLVTVVHSAWFVFPVGHVVIPSSKW